MQKKKFKYNSIVEGYYDHIFHKKKGVRSAWHHAKFDFVKKLINKKNSHLDIGCGPGTFVSLLENKLTFGVDVSKNQIKYAKKKYGSKVKRFYSFKKKFPFNKKFDTISMIELIEHLTSKEIQLTLNNCHKSLKKKGEIYITTPNYLSLWPLLEYFLNKISDMSYQHQHITKFNKYNIKNIIDKKKFEIVKIQSFLFLCPFLSFFSFNNYKRFSFIDKLITLIFPGFLIFVKIRKI